MTEKKARQFIVFFTMKKFAVLKKINSFERILNSQHFNTATIEESLEIVLKIDVRWIVQTLFFSIHVD